MTRLLALASIAIAAGIAFPGAASARTQSPRVLIEPKAAYTLSGAVVNVGLKIRCDGGSGEVVVNVTQSPPETPYPIAAGSGPQTVVCDGQMHEVAVTVTGFGFDAGTAFATADLSIGSPAVVASDQRDIDIGVV